MDGFEFWMSFDRSAAEGSWKQEREEGEEQKGMDSWTCEGSVDGGRWLF